MNQANHSDIDARILAEYGSTPKPTLARSLNMSIADLIDRHRHLVKGKGGEPKTVVDSSGEKLEVTDNGDTTTVNSVSARISTPEEAMAKAGIDTEVWEIEKKVVNSWEGFIKNEAGEAVMVPLWQVKLWLRRRQPLDPEVMATTMFEHLRKAAPQYPAYRTPTISQSDKHMLEISIADLHVGKYAWAEEVGENYDSKIAVERYRAAAEDLLAKASGYPIDKILLPTGNDLMHVDNMFNTTTKGTPQDVDTRWQKSFERTYEALVSAIEMLAEVAPVHVPIVPGNHDAQRAFYLGVCLDARFSNTDRVVVDRSPKMRKYVRYGATLLGLTHGNDERHGDLPSLMARECREHWSEVLHTEWHTGHLHIKRKTNYTAGDTHGGTVVRILPSLCGTDAWHFHKGYVKGPRAAEAYLWSYVDGYTGHFSHNVHDLCVSPTQAHVIVS